MTLYYTHREVPGYYMAGDPPFPMEVVEPVSVTFPPEVFPEEFKAVILTSTSQRVHGFSMTVQIEYVADAMMRQKGLYRIFLTPEAVARLQRKADGSFEIDLREFEFRGQTSI